MRRELIGPEQHPSGSGAWKREREAKEARFRNVEPAEVGGTLLSLGSSVWTYSALGVLAINCTDAIRIPGRA